jgi:hypothetical protein
MKEDNSKKMWQHINRFKKGNDEMQQPSKPLLKSNGNMVVSDEEKLNI